MRIARQFTAGFKLAITRVPEGRLNPPMSFQEEFIALLKKHNNEYDERYLS